MSALATAMPSDRFASSPLVGLRIDTERGPGTVTGPCDWGESLGAYWWLELDSGERTCRPIHVLTPHLPPPTRRTVMPAVAAAAKKSPATKPASTKPAAKKPPAKKSPLAVAKGKDDAALAKFLLAHQTYSDSTWSDRAKGETRRDKESRSAFIERVLLGKEAAS